MQGNTNTKTVPSPARLTRKLLRILLPAAFILIFFAWILIPMAYTVLWSVTDPKAGWAYPNALPLGYSLDTWEYVFKFVKIWDPIKNSLLIALATTAVAFLFSLPAAYALGRLDLKGKSLIKNLILLPMILPGMAMAIYVGRVINRMGLSGTYAGVILAHCLGGIPYMLRVLIVGFEVVPQDILDAAANLGGGPGVRFREVYLPMIAPSVVSGGIFTFINSMEEFTMTFIIGLPTIKTIPTVLFSFLGESYSATRGAVVTLILLVPNLILLMIVEKCIKTEYMGAALGKM